MGLNESDIRRIVWTFIMAFVASFVAVASGWSALPDFNTAKAAAIAAGIAGLSAVFSLVKNLFLSDGSTLK